MNNQELYQQIKVFKQGRNRLLGRLFNRSYRYVSDLAADFLSKKGYTYFRVGHIVALVHIDLDGVSVNTLAQKAGITKQGMSKIVKELQSHDFVIIQKDPLDARALMVKLSEKGLQCMIDWQACTEHINQEFSKVLSTEKLEQLKDILEVLVNHYETNVANGFDTQLLDLDIIK